MLTDGVKMTYYAIYGADTTGPIVEIDPPSCTWRNTALPLKITVEDEVNGSLNGVCYVSTSDTTQTSDEWHWTPELTSLQPTQAGTYYIFVARLRDRAGNLSTSETAYKTTDQWHIFGPYRFKFEAPTISIDPPSCTWRNSELSVEFFGDDEGAAFKDLEWNYSTSESVLDLVRPNWTIARRCDLGNSPISDADTYYVFIKRVRDRAGNLSESKTAYKTTDEYHIYGPYQFDWAGPTVSATVSNQSAWTNTDKTITITASDADVGTISGYYISTQQTTPTGASTEQWQAGGSPKTITKGLGTYYIWAKDGLGNISASYATVNVTKIEKTGPTITLSADNNNNTWARTVSVTVTIRDTESGLKKGADISYGWTESNTAPSSWTPAQLSSYNDGETGPVTFKAEKTTGTGKFYLWVRPKTLQDRAGNSTTVDKKSTGQFYIDNTGPVSLSVSITPTGWTNKNKTITISAKDDNVGVVNGYYISNTDVTPTTTTGAGWQTENTTTKPMGNYYIWAKDSLGNISASRVVASVTQIETEPPTITVTPANTQSYVQNTKVTIKVADTGGSGLASTNLQFYVSTSATTGTPQAFQSDGTYTIGTGLSGTYYLFVSQVKDNAGNLSTGTVSGLNGGQYQRFGPYYFDNTPPSEPTTMEFVYWDWSRYTQNTWANQTVCAAYLNEQPGPSGATDGLSGISKYQISEDNSSWVDYAYDYSKSLYNMSTQGTHNRYFRAVDGAGNPGPSILRTAKIDLTVPTITVTPTSCGWRNTSQSITISVSESGGSDLKSPLYQYYLSTSNTTLTGGTGKWVEYSQGKAFTIDPATSGTYYLFVRKLTDNAGNVSTASGGTDINAGDVACHRFGTYQFDKDAPTGTVTASKTVTNESTVTIYVSASDTGGSGVSRVEINGWFGGNYATYLTEIDGKLDSSNRYYATFNFKDIKHTTTGNTNNGNGTYKFDAHIYDVAGNRKVATAINVVYDTTSPTIKVSQESCGWRNSALSITITVTETGGASLSSPVYEYCLSTNTTSFTGSWTTYQTGVPISLNPPADGKYYLFVKQVKDTAGNTSTGGTVDTVAGVACHRWGTYNFDKTAPTIKVSPANYNTSWTQSLKITITTEDTGGSTLNTPSYQYFLSTTKTGLTGGEWKPYVSGTAFDVTGLSGTYYLFVKRVTDYAGNTSIADGTVANVSGTNYQVFGEYQFDNTNPVAATLIMRLGSESGSPYQNESWTASNVYIALTGGEDAHSGVQSSVYSVNGQAATSKPQTLTGTGTYNITVTTTDNVGLKHQRTYTVKIDQTKPEVGILTMKLKDSSGDPYASGTWTNQSVYISLANGKDLESGHNTTKYSVNNGTAKTGSEILTSEAKYTIVVTTTDMVGNQSQHTYYVYIDKTAPTISVSTTSCGWRKAALSVTITVTEAGGSNLSTPVAYEYCLSTTTSSFTGNWTTYQSGKPITLDPTDGTYYLFVKQVRDVAGNTSTGGEVATVATIPCHRWGTYNFDKTGPTISFDPNVQDTWTKSTAVKVTAQDSLSGLIAGAKIQYQWVLSTGTPGNSWTELAATNNAGEKSVTWTVPAQASSALSGIYKLYIKAGVTQDNITDATKNTNAQASTNTFKFDNTKPTVTLSPSAQDDTRYVKGGTAITVTVADAHSGLIAAAEFQYQWVLEGQSPAVGSWVSVKLTNSAGLGSTTYTIPASASSNLNGRYKLYIRDTITKDNVTEATKNTNAQTISGLFYFDNTAPVIKFSPNTQTQWSRAGAEITVTIDDKYQGTGTDVAGLPENITIQYQWVKSDGTLTNNWQNITGKNAAGAANTTRTIPAAASKDFTGVYYLYVRAGCVSDYVKTTVANQNIQTKSDLFNFDNTSPTIRFVPNNQTTYSKSGSEVVVHIADPDAGLLQDVTIQYQWVIDGSAPVEANWKQITGGINSLGAHSTTRTIPADASNGLTGKYYLYIREGTVGDNVKDETKNTNARAQSGEFYFDNTTAQIEFTPSSQSNWTKGTTVTIKATDANAGLEQNATVKYQWVKSGESPVDANWTTAKSTNPAGATSTTWIVQQTESNAYSGTYNLYVKGGVVKDNVPETSGNFSAEVKSGEFNFDATKPVITLSPNDQKDYYTIKGKDVTVNIKDAHAGLSANVAIKYQWVLKGSEVSSSAWKEIKGSNGAGDKSTTRTIPASESNNFTGIYYLYIQAGCVRDNITNPVTENVNIQVQSGEFHFDNIKPTIQFDPNTQTSYTRRRTAVTVTVSDANAGLAENVAIQYQWAKSSADLKEAGWLIAKGSNAAAAPSTKILVPSSDEANLTGQYYLFIKEGCVRDNVHDSTTQNSNVQTNSSVFNFDNTKPVVSKFEPNSQTESWSRGTEVKVTATDADAGFVVNAKMQYQWVLKGQSPNNNNWKELTSNNVAAAKTATWTVPKSESSNLSGTYILYIRADIIKDNVTDTTKNGNIVKASGEFQFDNEKPVIKLTPDTTGTNWVKDGSKVTVTATDDYAGMMAGAQVQYQWVVSTGTPSATAWTTLAANNEAGTNSVTWIVPAEKSKAFNGLYKLYIKAGVTKDNITDTTKNENNEVVSKIFQFDNEKPEITFNMTTLTTWKKGGQEVTVTAKDTYAGLIAGAQIEYQWVLENATPAESSWTPLTAKNNAGEHSTTWTVPASASSTLTGKYKLYIRAGITKDNVVNTDKNTNVETHTDLFFFDNTKPVVSKFEPQSQTTSWSRGTQVVVTATDPNAGLVAKAQIQYQWVLSTGTPSASGWTTLTANNEAGATSVSWTVEKSASSTLNGKYKLYIKEGIIQDNVSDATKNVNEQKVSGEFYFDNEKPVIALSPTTTGNDWVKDGRAVTVTATDNYAGMIASAQVQYQWVLGEGAPAEGSWNTLTANNEAGKSPVTWTVPAEASSKLNGLYKLYIKAGETKDNITDATKNVNNQVVSQVFKFDNERPAITFSMDTLTTWKKDGQQIIVTAKDNYAGLIASAQIEYQWVLDGQSPNNDNWAGLTSNNTAGQSTTTWTVPASASSKLTGKYRLYIRAGITKDNVVNTDKNTNLETHTDLFFFDNTKPVVSTFEPDSQTESWSRGTQVVVTAKDPNAGFVVNAKMQYQWVASNGTPDPNAWTPLIADNEAGANTVSWTVEKSASSKLNGKYKLYIKDGVIQDNVSDTTKNVNEQKVSGEFYFDNEKPAISLSPTTTGDEWVKAGRVVTVTATDDYAGMIVGAQIEYQWVLKDGSPAEKSWIPLTATNKAGANSVTWTVPVEASNELNGLYKLYIKEGVTQDNITDEPKNVNNQVVSDIFKFDNERPEITFEPNSQPTWVKSEAVTVKATDGYAGLIENAQAQYQWVLENKEPDDNNWKDLASNNKAGDKSTTWLVPADASSTLTGIYRLYIRAGITKDNVVNDVVKDEKNTNVETYTDLFYFDNTNPVVGTLQMHLDTIDGETYNSGTWTKHSVFIHKVDGDDAHSGHRETRYTVLKDQAPYVTDETGDITLEQTGVYDITVTTEDNLYNTSTSTYQVKIDKVDPIAGTMDMRVDNAQGEEYPNGKWINRSVYINKVDGKDDHSGHLLTNYTVTKDGKPFVNDKTTFTILEEDGVYEIVVTTEDKSGIEYDEVGHKTSNSYTVRIDKTPPESIITGEATGVTDGLVRHFDANNNMGNGHSKDTKTWKDLSLSNKDANLNGGTFEDAYLNLNGTSDWVNLGEVSLTTAATIEAQIKINEIQSGEKTILCNYEAGGMGIALRDGKPETSVYVNGIYQRVMLDEVLDTDRIYNISGTYDGKALNLYIDGVLHATKTISGTIGQPVSNTVMAIGANPSGSTADGNFANIKVYSARIYNKALSQTEIKKNLNADRINPEKLVANDGTVTLSFIFTEDVYNFDAEDITITNGTKGKFTRISDSEYTLEVTGIVAEQDLLVEVAKDSYEDRAGNHGNAPTTTRKRDTINPTVTITSNAPKDPTNVPTLTYTFEFSEPTVGFTTDDITVTNGNKGEFKQISSSKFTLVVTNEHSYIQKVTVPNGACNDDSGNLNEAKSAQVQIDRTKPTIEGISSKPSSETTYRITVTGIQDPMDNEVQSGLRGYYVSKEPNAPLPSSDEWVASDKETVELDNMEEATTYYFWVIDNADNISDVISITTKTIYYGLNNEAWFETFAELMAEASSDRVNDIKVLKDVTENTSAAVYQDAKLNTNGKTMTTNTGITVQKGKTLEIVGTGTIQKGTANYATQNEANSTTTLNGATINGKMYASGGTINIVLGHVNGNIYGGSLVESQDVDTSNINIKGGTITGNIHGGHCYGTGTVKTVNIEMTGGTVEWSIQGGAEGGSGSVQTANINVSGGTIQDYIAGGGSRGTGRVDTAIINISGGEIWDDVCAGEIFGSGSVGTATLTMTKGTVRGSVYGGGHKFTGAETRKC